MKNLVEHYKSRLFFFGIISIAFLGIVLYSNILHAPFVFDDYSAIVDNDVIKNFNASLRDISNNRYLTSLTFALNYALGDLKPFGYHLVNNLVHVINAILVYYLVLITYRTPHMNNSKVSVSFIAFSSAFIFVAHPVQTQAVTYISQRATSMAAMFYLLSIISYIKWRLSDQMHDTGHKMHDKKGIVHRASWILYLCSLLFAILAMKTKEIAFTLPIVIVLYEFSFFGEIQDSKLKTQNRKRLLYLFPIIFTMLIIPFRLLNFEGSIESIAESIDMHSRETIRISRAEYLVTQFRVIITYLRLLICPINQSLDYRYPIYHSFLNPQVFFSILFLLAIFGIAIYLFFRSRHKSQASSFIAFGILWFFITLSVESTIIPIKDVIVEHRLYLPSIGFFIAFVVSVEYLLRNKKAKIALICLIVILLSVATYNRNIVWKDEQTLWKNVIAMSPNNVRAYNELGSIFRDEEKYAEANELFEKALKINSNYPLTYYNLGFIKYKLRNYESAIVYFNKCLQFDMPANILMEVFNTLGMTYSDMGRDEDAVIYFRKAIKSYPVTVVPYNNLGLQYIKMGKFDEAIEIFEEGLYIRKSHQLSHNLSLAHNRKKELEKVLKIQK